QWEGAADDTDPLIRRVLSSDPRENPSSFRLRQFQEQFSNHVEVFTTDRYGAVLGATNKTSDYEQADEPWWQEAWNRGLGGIHVGRPEFDESTGVYAVNIAVPIWDETRQLIGVLRSTVDVRAVLDILQNPGFGATSRLQVIDTGGKYLFNPSDRRSVGKESGLDPKSFTAVGFVESETELVGYARAARSRGIAALEHLPWITLARIERSEAFAPVQQANRVALVAGVVALLAAVAVAYLLSRTLTRQVRKIRETFSRIGIGDFNARVDVVSGDEIGQMANGLNAMLDNTLTLIQSREDRDRMQESIMKLLDEVSGVAEGDLSREAEVTPEITGAIADSFNFMIAELREIIGNVQSTTEGVTGLATEVRGKMEGLSAASERQAKEILEASKAVGSLAQLALRISETAAGSAEVAERSVSNARQGAAAVQSTIAGMQAIRGQVQETSKRIKRLGESSQEIGEIVQLIGDIAERTSILA
ncbi:MAG: HAMP domain-containing protein, partial [Acidobacteria bacterium]|nr:HAMP domain-containing protein [Acidobacteriota bacterium]